MVPHQCFIVVVLLSSEARSSLFLSTPPGERGSIALVDNCFGEVLPSGPIKSHTLKSLKADIRLWSDWE